MISCCHLRPGARDIQTTAIRQNRFRTSRDDRLYKIRIAASVRCVYQFLAVRRKIGVEIDGPFLVESPDYNHSHPSQKSLFGTSAMRDVETSFLTCQGQHDFIKKECAKRLSLSASKKRFVSSACDSDSNSLNSTVRLSPLMLYSLRTADHFQRPTKA
jgi:hypothetical protein